MPANFEDHGEINRQIPDHNGNRPNIGRIKNINHFPKIILAAKNYSVIITPLYIKNFAISSIFLVVSKTCSYYAALLYSLYGGSIMGTLYWKRITVGGLYANRN